MYHLIIGVLTVFIVVHVFDNEIICLSTKDRNRYTSSTSHESN